MLTEERFGIGIADSEAEKIRTPAMLIDLVMAKITIVAAKVCQSQRSFYLVRRAIIRLTDIDRAQVTPKTTVRQLVARDREIIFWPELRTAVGARSWPALDFASEIDLAIKAIVIAIWPCSAFVSWFLLSKTFDAINAAVWSIFAGFIATAGAAALLMRFGKPFQTFIPRRIQTLADLIPFVNTSDEIKWSREDVARVVHDIVDEVLAPGDKYRENADFVRGGFIRACLKSPIR